MVCRILNSEGSSQLLLPAGLSTGSIAVQWQWLLALLHHLVACLPLAGALHCHFHQRLGMPAKHYFDAQYLDGGCHCSQGHFTVTLLAAWHACETLCDTQNQSQSIIV